jgi:hypothetical protein
MTERSKKRRDLLERGKTVELEDEHILQRLRGLGYIE